MILQDLNKEKDGAVAQERLVRNLNVRIRILADGRYVAEERHGWWIFSTWQAIDWKNPNFLWSPGDVFYGCCLGDYDQILRGVAGRGHSLPNAKLIHGDPDGANKLAASSPLDGESS